jgi:hypothetical protein
MCPLQPVKLRLSPVNDARAQRGCNGSSRCRISRYECRVCLLAAMVSCVAQLCDARAEPLRALKPFVACCNLIIVIPLYAWERIRVMTISSKVMIETQMQFSGDAGAVSGCCSKNRGGACG